MLPGFRVLATEVIDNDAVLSVETPRRPVGCPACGAVARITQRPVASTSPVFARPGAHAESERPRPS